MHVELFNCNFLFNSVLVFPAQSITPMFKIIQKSPTDTITTVVDGGDGVLVLG